jgi:hypothetical protein
MEIVHDAIEQSLHVQMFSGWKRAMQHPMQPQGNNLATRQRKQDEVYTVEFVAM